MYLARPVSDDSPTWSPGRYEPAVGHYVKYEKEFRAASAYATIIRSRADWENGAWMQFDPAWPLLARFPCRAVFGTPASAPITRGSRGLRKSCRR